MLRKYLVHKAYDGVHTIVHVDALSLIKGKVFVLNSHLHKCQSLGIRRLALADEILFYDATNYTSVVPSRCTYFFI